MKPREIERRILEAGWVLDPSLGKGSHRVYRHPQRPGIVTLPWHTRDLKKGTLEGILKSAGIK